MGMPSSPNTLTSSSERFRDFSNSIDETISQGNKAFSRLTYRGTHRGELFGIAPTGKSVQYAGAAVFRFRGDKITTLAHMIARAATHAWARKPQPAICLRFPGSPTVRVDEIDVEAPLPRQRGYGLSCRTYLVNRKLQGVPTREMIREAIHGRAYMKKIE
jgi:hypothetical protein